MSERKYSSPVAQAWQAKAEAEAQKKQPIAVGHVRFERHDYSYGRQGQVTLVGYILKDLPEHEAIKWIAYGCSSVTWPDGGFESFDMRVSPVEHRYGCPYGELTYADGHKATGTLSRLPNVFVEYYGARLVKEAERGTFRMIIDGNGNRVAA